MIGDDKVDRLTKSVYKLPIRNLTYTYTDDRRYTMDVEEVMTPQNTRNFSTVKSFSNRNDEISRRLEHVDRETLDNSRAVCRLILRGNKTPQPQHGVYIG